MYYRESFEYSPIKMFFNSNSADTIVTRGDVTFNLNRFINLPSHVIGYVSLNELTIPNTDYNISKNNNTLVLTDKTGTNTPFTVTPGNYTVSSFMTALNAAFQAATTVSFRGIVVTYSDITNRFPFTHSSSYFLRIVSTSTMNSVLGFETGEINTTIVPTTISTTTAIVGDQITITALNNTLNFSYDGTTYSVASVLATRTCSDHAALMTLSFTGRNIPVTVTYNAATHLFTFTNNTTNLPLKILGTSTMLVSLGFALANQDYTLTTAVATSSLVSSRIVDLSGNNSFYLTTNLGLANYSFLNVSNKGGANVLGKIQLTTSPTGVEFYNNLTAFKTRFYDTNITSLHIVLYDEDFNKWVPLSDWSCVIEMTFYEKYDLTTKQKTNNLLFSN